jgi:hypothetical protein
MDVKRKKHRQTVNLNLMSISQSKYSLANLSLVIEIGILIHLRKQSIWMAECLNNRMFTKKNK